MQSPFSALMIYRKWLKQRNSRVDRSLSFANLVIHMNYKVSPKIQIRCIFRSVIDRRMEWNVWAEDLNTAVCERVSGIDIAT